MASSKEIDLDTSASSIASSELESSFEQTRSFADFRQRPSETAKASSFDDPILLDSSGDETDNSGGSSPSPPDSPPAPLLERLSAQKMPDRELYVPFLSSHSKEESDPTRPKISAFAGKENILAPLNPPANPVPRPPLAQKQVSSSKPFDPAEGQQRKAILIDPLPPPPHQQKQQPDFKVAGTYKTLQRQLEVHDDLYRTMAARLPDGGAQLMAQRRAIEARMNSIKNPVKSSRPLDATKAAKSKQAMLNHHLGGLTSGAVEQIYKTMEACPGRESVAKDPEGLKVQLFPHQKQALAWAQWREQQYPSGGILADEMGLGKTLTMLSLIVSSVDAARSKADKEPTSQGLVRSPGTLIVCPKSLMLQWEVELCKRFTRGHLECQLHHGTSKVLDPRRLSRYDVVLTSYNLVASEFNSYSDDPSSGPVVGQKRKKRSAAGCPLFKVRWSRVVLDEAHIIRNPDTALSQGVAALVSDHRWCVTGTPIQNKQLDLYSLIRFLNLAPFNDRRIWREQVQKGAKGLERMQALVKGLVLRRMKSDLGLDGKKLVDLPEKKMFVHELSLTDQEQAIHDAIFAHTKSTLEKWLNQKEPGESTAEPEPPKPVSEAVTRMGEVVRSLGLLSSAQPDPSSGYSFILSLLLRIRQSCVHANLMVPNKKQPPRAACQLKEEDEEEEADGLADRLGQLSIGSTQQEGRPSCRPKMEDLPKEFHSSFQSTRVAALMEEILQSGKDAPDDKCVVFSQWTSMLDIIEFHLRQHKLSYARIDGQVSAQERQSRMNTFNSPARHPQILTVSLLAGGVGLNLIGGNRVFIMDLHWNPFNEVQAFDRVHRMGQTKDVQVHRFVCEKTIEERILALQKTKQEMAQNILSGAAVKNSNKLSLDDLMELFEVA